MPELPEVEVVRQGLDRQLPGATFVAIETNGKALRLPVPADAMAKLLPGATVTAIRRRAKYLLIDLDSGAVVILHLGMTGKLGIFPQQSPPAPHDHVVWRLDNDRELRFNDVRRFGSIVILPPDRAAELETSFFRACGPEPFDQAFSADYLHRLAAGRSQPVKNFIMDGHVVSGVGNIYANESLFAAGIRPTRQIGRIGLKKWQLLITEIRKVLDHAITCGGSSISDFIGTNGESGYFQVNFRVYDRAGKACPRCAEPIKQIKLGGRSSFYCPRCQR